MDTQLDFYTVKDLEARYRVTRSRVYARINGLKEKGYTLEPEKVEGRSIFNAEQVALLDRLDSHMRAGKDIHDFPAVDGRNHEGCLACIDTGASARESR
ncbi:MAG: hypothetical protein HC866_21160, partial [Leptolyngbyaceae cyanobacterium RU_5_1]|nr:hypothetical protein [Leptolyngbyaceae cyanobacterium RU_5_1]